MEARPTFKPPPVPLCRPAASGRTRSPIRKTRVREAEEAEERARELAQKQEQVLAEARAEAQKLLADARAAADNVKNDLMRQAQEEIAAEKDRAKKEIGLERSKAIDELKQVTVDLTLEASARLLRRELRDEDHRRLAREVVEEVATRL